MIFEWRIVTIQETNTNLITRWWQPELWPAWAKPAVVRSSWGEYPQILKTVCFLVAVRVTPRAYVGKTGCKLFKLKYSIKYLLNNSLAEIIDFWSPIIDFSELLKCHPFTAPYGTFCHCLNLPKHLYVHMIALPPPPTHNQIVDVCLHL